MTSSGGDWIILPSLRMSVYYLGNCMRLDGRDTDCRGDYIHPEWFSLDTSRGMETPGLKSFMRFSVIISDYALYVPALLAYTQFVIPAGRKIDKVQFPLELY